MYKRRQRDLSMYAVNPNIERVTQSNIQFTKAFKIRAIKQYQAGLSPTQIFEDAGINLSDFEKCYARKSIIRWFRASSDYGLNKINDERRGINSSGRPSQVKKFKSLEEEITYLRAENNFLKKIQALGKASGVKKNSK
jgi:transposase